MKEAWTELVGPKFSNRPGFEFVENNPELPNILIYGDSISMGYTPLVQEQLTGKANVYRIYCNGGDTSRVIPAMQKMREAMADYWNFKWDVIHFNAGLHDLKYLDENGKYDTKNGKQVRSPEEYGEKLEEIFAYFKKIAPDAKLIFATTTPVPEGARGRIAGDAAIFNQAALEVLKGYPHIVINDLYALTKPDQTKWWKRPGDVHYNPTGLKAQSEQVAKAILSALASIKKLQPGMENTDRPVAGTPVSPDRQAPFSIPPHGQPEFLLEDITFEPPTAMAFDSKNRPYLLNSRLSGSYGQLRTLRDGKWTTLSLIPPLKEENRPVERHQHGKGVIVIDNADCIYISMWGHLLYSDDQGKTFTAYPPGSLELRTSTSQPMAYPPAIARLTDYRYVDRGEERKPGMAWWAKRGTFSLFLPTKNATGLDLGEPILITEKCSAAGSAGHSGGTSFAVTTGERTHVVYAETPEDVRSGGNPIYIATVDRKSREVVARQFLVKAPPKVSDVHARPTITVDSQGYLHVLSGSHNQPFFYMRSLKSGDITGGWTEPLPLFDKQCYASIVCDGDDRLHSVFRRWMPHPTLGYSRAAATDGTWCAPTTLVDAGKTDRGSKNYGIFYHRLFIDRASTLYLRFTFFEFKTGKEGVYPDVLAVSTDGGESWHLDAESVLMERANIQ